MKRCRASTQISLKHMHRAIIQPDEPYFFSEGEGKRLQCQCTHITHIPPTNALIGAHSTHYSHNRSRKPPAVGVKSWVSWAVRTVHSALLFLAKPRKNAKYLVNIAWRTHYTYSLSTAYAIPPLKKDIDESYHYTESKTRPLIISHFNPISSISILVPTGSC